MGIRRKKRATKPSAVAKRRAAKRASPRKGATSGKAPWLLSRQAGMKLLGVSESTWYRFRRESSFPCPVGGRDKRGSQRWRRTDLKRWAKDHDRLAFSVAPPWEKPPEEPQIEPAKAPVKVAKPEEKLRELIEVSDKLLAEVRARSAELTQSADLAVLHHGRPILTVTPDNILASGPAIEAALEFLRQRLDIPSSEAIVDDVRRRVSGRS